MIRHIWYGSIFSVLVCGSLQGQCTANYNDGSVDGGNTTFTAWSTVTDYYNTSSCLPPWTGFSHSYHTRVSIISPFGRIAFNDAYSSQYGGGGSATAFASLVIVEDGNYDILEDSSIDCSVAGAGFLLASQRRPFFAVGKARTQYGYDTAFGGCGYHKSCSPQKNHWAGDSFTSMAANNGGSIPPNSCWAYVSKFHRFIKAGSLERYWSITDELGRSWYGHDEYLDCDGPLP